MVGIYKITNPKGKVYIGQSINIDKRFYQYQTPKKERTGVKILNSLIKYGIENHNFDILEECNINELNQKEIYWIKYFNTTADGLNIELGGKGFPRSDETKEKIRKNKIGKNTKKIKQYSLNNQYIKTWNSIVEAERVFGMGIKSVLNKSKFTAGGFIWLYEYEILPPNYKIPTHKNTKPIIQYSLDGEVVKDWKSLTQVQKVLGFNKNNISNTLTGKSKTAFGYIWKYKK
jgi:group I intron endonuclease